MEDCQCHKVTRPADSLKHGILIGRLNPLQSWPLHLFARQKLETQMCSHLEFGPNWLQSNPASSQTEEVKFSPPVSFLHYWWRFLFQSVLTHQCWSWKHALLFRFLNSRMIYSTCSTSPSTDTCCWTFSPCSPSSSCRWCWCWCNWCGWWLFMCVLRLVCWVNRFPHSGQGNRYLSSSGKWITWEKNKKTHIKTKSGCHVY